MAISARKEDIRLRVYGGKGEESSRLRRRRHVLSKQFGIPDTLLGGSLNQVMRKCGKGCCHCASGDGHPMWTLTVSVGGKRRVEFIPDELATDLRSLVDESRAYREALGEILAINFELLTLWRRQEGARGRRTRTTRQGDRRTIQRRTARR